MLVRFCSFPTQHGGLLLRMRLTPTMKELIAEFKAAPGHFLSKEDIRQDVLHDELANDGTIRQLIHDTRKRLKKSEIITIHNRGYILAKQRSLPTIRHQK